MWQDNVIALAGSIRKPERLAAWKVRNVQHLVQEQEAIMGHLHDALIVMQPGNELNGPVSVSAIIWAESVTYLTLQGRKSCTGLTGLGALA
jgi:hypothetical protein